MYIVSIMITNDGAKLKHTQMFQCESIEAAEIIVDYVNSINTNDIYHVNVSSIDSIDTVLTTTLLDMKALTILNTAARQLYLNGNSVAEISDKKQTFDNPIYIDPAEEWAI